MGVRVSLVAEAHTESIGHGQRIRRSIRTRKQQGVPFPSIDRQEPSLQTIGQYGIHFQSEPIMHSDRADPNILHDRLQELKSNQCEVVLFILNNVNEEIYKSIKYLGNQKLGIVTQSVIFTLSRTCNTRSALDVRTSLPWPETSRVTSSIW